VIQPVGPQPPPPAAELAARELSAAEWDAFRRGYEFSFAAATRLARRFGAYGMADDLVSEAKVKMVDALTRPVHPLPFPSSDERFRASFLTILYRVALDDLRRWDPLDHVGIEEADDTLAPDEDRQPYHEALAELVTDALLTLTLMQVDAVLSTHWDGKSRAEVAMDLEIAVKTYDTHLRLAQAQLRRFVLAAAAENPAVPEELKRYVAWLARRHARRAAVDGRRVRAERVAA